MIEQPDLHIDRRYQDGLEGLLNNKEKSIVENTELTEGVLQLVKFKNRKQALSAMFYMIEILEKIYKQTEDFTKMQKKFSIAFEEI